MKVVKVNEALKRAAINSVEHPADLAEENDRHLRNINAVNVIPDRLENHHRARIAQAVASSLELRDVFDPNALPETIPVSQPVIKGFREEQIQEKGYRLALVNALALVKPIDRPLISRYKQICYESHLDFLVKSTTKLRKILEKNSGLASRHERRAVDELHQYAATRRSLLSGGIDRGVSSVLNDINDRLRQCFCDEDQITARKCADELHAALLYRKNNILRRTLTYSDYPWIIKSLALINKYIGISHSCLKPRELKKYWGDSLLVIINQVRPDPFDFRDHRVDAQKKPWHLRWRFWEFRRGGERVFVGERVRDGLLSLVKYYPVHPDPEGGYTYELDVIKQMNGTPL